MDYLMTKEEGDKSEKKADEWALSFPFLLEYTMGDSLGFFVVEYEENGGGSRILLSH